MSEAETGRGTSRVWWIQFLVGRPDAWGPAAVSAAFATILHDAVTGKNAVLVLALAALYWLGYSVNDYCDASIDALDGHKAGQNVFVRRPSSRRALVVAIVLVNAAVLPVFGWFGLEGIAVFVVASLAMWAYSARPLRLKSKPGLDLLAHGTFVLTFPYWASLELIDAVWSISDWIVLGVAFFTSVAGQLRQQIRDFDVDSITDVNFTTSVGPDTSLFALKIITIVTFLVFISSIFMGLISQIAAPLGLLSLPALIDRVTAQRSTRPPTRAYNLFSFVAAGYCMFLMGAALFWRSRAGQ